MQGIHFSSSSRRPRPRPAQHQLHSSIGVDKEGSFALSATLLRTKNYDGEAARVSVKCWCAAKVMKERLREAVRLHDTMCVHASVASATRGHGCVAAHAQQRSKTSGRTAAPVRHGHAPGHHGRHGRQSRGQSRLGRHPLLLVLARHPSAWHNLIVSSSRRQLGDFGAASGSRCWLVNPADTAGVVEALAQLAVDQLPQDALLQTAAAGLNASARNTSDHISVMHVLAERSAHRSCAQCDLCRTVGEARLAAPRSASAERAAIRA